MTASIPSLPELQKKALVTFPPALLHNASANSAALSTILLCNMEGPLDWSSRTSSWTMYGWLCPAL